MRETQRVGSFASSVAFAVERVVAPVEGMHRVIAGRWFNRLGSIGTPVRTAHEAITEGVYGSIRLGGSVVGAGLGATNVIGSGTADSFQAFVNGLWGDALGRRRDRLEIPMGVRDRNGSPVAVGHQLVSAFPAATGRIVVLVHGLIETEGCWLGTEEQPGLIRVLEDHPVLTPVPIRYNSGLRVSDNGERLASLLEDVHGEWPVPVQSIALIGHSMGGLVIRSACEAAMTAGHRWIDDLDDIVTVATPHRGSPLEKAANALAWGLSIAEETRPLADFVNGRSVGIKDLRFGAIVEDDWKGIDPDALLTDTVGDHPLPPDVAHHVIAGVMTANPTHPFGTIVGDFVVRPASSMGGPDLDVTNVAILGRRNHFDFLNDPTVIACVTDWLAPLACDTPGASSPGVDPEHAGINGGGVRRHGRDRPVRRVG